MTFDVNVSMAAWGKINKYNSSKIGGSSFTDVLDSEHERDYLVIILEHSSKVKVENFLSKGRLSGLPHSIKKKKFNSSCFFTFFFNINFIKNVDQKSYF